METICGIDCRVCGLRETCGGCVETGGRPFGGACMLAACCGAQGCAHAGHAQTQPCRLKAALIAELNALGIPDMDTVTELNALKGSLANLAYTLPNGQKVRFWDDAQIYLGHLLPKRNSDRMYGLVADARYLMVCECERDGTDAEIVLYKRRDGV